MTFNFDNNFNENLAGVFELEALDLKRIDEPEFDDLPTVFVHDWRRYLPDEIASSWNHFTQREKILIYGFCNKQADAEEWD